MKLVTSSATEKTYYEYRKSVDKLHDFVDEMQLILKHIFADKSYFCIEHLLRQNEVTAE